jgi:hypothetical protein
MVIGFPSVDVVEDESDISRNNGNFHWISPYGTRRECLGWGVWMDVPVKILTGHGKNPMNRRYRTPQI